MNNLQKKINRTIGKALHRYSMIEDGDRILVGLSGGKDSLTLLWFLRERLRHIPVSYELFPVHIDPGFKNGFSDALYDYGCRNGYDIHIEKTDYGVISHSDFNRENPCFLCSRLRRKRLFEIAEDLGCRKLAFGHHRDDLIETLIMNMFYSGEISTFVPFQSFFKGEYAVIRPLYFTDEDDIKKFAGIMAFPEFENPCPSAGQSKRSEVKNILNTLYRRNRKIKGNIFRAMRNIKMDYLPK